MLSAPIAADLNNVAQRYPNIYVIVSPPRCSSTAFARVFWEHPTIGYYSHEPFEQTYYDDAGLESVQQNLLDPLDLDTDTQAPDNGADLVIKEMPYQVWNHFPMLADLAAGPVVFLIRDPRINIASRMEKKREVGDSPFFPHIETGWTLLQAQINYCRENQIPYLIVDGADFRNQPSAVFEQVFEALNLGFSSDQLSWQPQPEVDLDNLDGEHTHLYDEVLESGGLQADNVTPLPLSSFPVDQGLRDHVLDCLEIYHELRQDPARIRP